MICVSYIGAVTFSLVTFGDVASKTGTVGLAISMARKLINLCKWGIKQTTQLENQMISVERVAEYSELQSEFEDVGTTPPDWPSTGKISYQNVFLSYTNVDKSILSDLSLEINPKEKLGIVGRSGSGKSSLIKLLLRLAEISSGNIFIDDLNINEIDLKYLRQKISIIPQAFDFFSGSIRANLDPYKKYEDLVIWDALEKIKLKNFIMKFVNGLDTDISIVESQFSSGQKQLLCLVRSLIGHNKIVILDEATAAMDKE